MSDWDSEAALKRIEAISVNARTTWFGLLALLTFVLVTLLGVQHIDFFGYGRETDLPLVNVSVPTERFFIAAPVLVAAVYAYFHFYLMKLWDELGRAEPVIDGRPIGDLVFPWLVTDAAMLLRTDGAAPRRALAQVSAFTALSLTWFFGLAVLAYGLWQSFPAHNAFMSVLNCAALLFAGWVGVTSYVVMRRRIRRRQFDPGTERVWTGWRGVLGAIICFIMLIASWERSTNGASRFASDIWLSGAQKAAEIKDASGDLTRKRHLAIAPWLPIAPINLAEAQLTEKPANWLDKSTAERDFRKRWCARRELAWAMCAKEPDFQQADFRRVWCAAKSRNPNGTVGEERLAPEACEEHFRQQETDFREEWEERRAEYLSVLKKPVLEDRNLKGADLTSAFLADIDFEAGRLEGANLGGARLERANFFLARLEGVNLFQARLEGADFRLAQLQRAILIQARLEGANLGGAQLEGANLGGAQLEGANLGDAQLNGADLSWAQLEGANLEDAQLQRANLLGAKLVGASLERAKLTNAILREAWLNRANLVAARLEGADLFKAQLANANLRVAVLVGSNLSGARLEKANLHEAQLKQADMRNAWLKEANLVGARLEGANLIKAQFQSAEFSSAVLGPSLLNSADFTKAKNLTQEMLDQAVGDQNTVLPRVDGAPLYVWTCWEEAPTNFDALIEMQWPWERDDLRAQWLCGPEGRRKTGRTAER